MGVIYKAHDPDIGRVVAIKLVRADLVDGDDREEFLTRFRREARAAGRCTHPNIVAIYDFAIHEGNPFLALEYVEGVGLGQALKGVGHFPPAEAVTLIVQVLAALDAAHTAEIVHRDIKPANIMLLPSGQVKVTDFGVSRINTSDLTQSGAVIGTPAYMSPEQCRGEPVDARSDLFSVGTVLYELLSGVRAFKGRNVTEVTYQLLMADPPDLATQGGVPRHLIDVLRRSMAKNRDARYGSAREMSDALIAAMREDPAGATMIGDRTVMTPSPAAFAPVATTPVDEATLDTIGRRLARYIGPIAKHLVRDAARKTHSIETLCETVSRTIGKDAERQRFLAESLDDSQRHGGTALRSTGVRSPQTAARATPATTVAPSTGISAEQIDRAERALTRVLGPIARLLVKRAVPGAASEAVLWERLATQIQRPADRDAFLKAASGR